MKSVFSFAGLFAICLVLLTAGPKENSLKPAVRRKRQSDASGGLPRLGVSLSGLRHELQSRSRKP